MSISTIITTPDRSRQQRLAALTVANAVREERARLKRDVKAGRHRIERILAEPPEYARRMRILDLLLAAPKWGRVRAEHALRQCKISPTKTIGGLTDRQRRDLVHYLGRPWIARTLGWQEEER